MKSFIVIAGILTVVLEMTPNWHACGTILWIEWNYDVLDLHYHPEVYSFPIRIQRKVNEWVPKFLPNFYHFSDFPPQCWNLVHLWHVIDIAKDLDDLVSSQNTRLLSTGSSIVYSWIRFLYLASTYCLSMVKQFWICSWNATYDSLLGSNKLFRQPIPLSVSPLTRSKFLPTKNTLLTQNRCRIWTGNGRFSGGRLGTGGIVWLRNWR